MQIFAFQNTARQVAVGETDVYGSVFGVVAIIGMITACAGVVKADGAVCSLKQDTEGKFELNIDGVSHVSWFRRKKDEFMETLGIPTRIQNRGINL